MSRNLPADPPRTMTTRLTTWWGWLRRVLTELLWPPVTPGPAARRMVEEWVAKYPQATPEDVDVFVRRVQEAWRIEPVWTGGEVERCQRRAWRTYRLDELAKSCGGRPSTIRDAAGRLGETEAELWRDYRALERAQWPNMPRGLEPPPSVARADHHEGGQNHWYVCVDLGTAASTVAALSEQREVLICMFPFQNDDGSVSAGPIIESDMGVPWAGSERERGPAVLGLTAQNLASLTNPDFEYHRSLKRMLSDVARSKANEPDYNPVPLLCRRIACMIEELLLLALVPEESGTLRANEKNTRHAELLRKAGIPRREEITAAINRDFLDLRLCIPNAFGDFEEGVIRQAGREAARRVAARLWSKHQEAGKPPPARVALVREAEAVAWWAIQKSQEEIAEAGDRTWTWLVFDIGAGSSDAAVVHVEAHRDQKPRVRMQHQAGVPFAGGDLDLLTLKASAEAAGLRTAEDLARHVAGGEMRVVHARNGEETKLRLLKQLGAQSGLWPELAKSVSDVRQSAADSLKSLVGTVQGTEINVTISGMPGDATRTLDVARWVGGYATFLRAAVVGVLDSLHTQAPNLRLDRVILSGRGTQAPGVVELVREIAHARGWIEKHDQVGWAPMGSGYEGSEHRKLVCVLGIAYAALYEEPAAGLTHSLSEEICYSPGLKPLPVLSRGSRMEGSVARATVRVPGGGPGSGEGPVEFIQRRVPEEVVRALKAQREDRWPYRYLGRLRVNRSHISDLHLAFDRYRSRLTVCVVRDGVWSTRSLETQDVGLPINPITGLEFGWENNRP